MKIIDGNITSPKGFRAAGAHIGVKKVKKDLSLVLSDVPAAAGGVFTTNIVKAAPVQYDMSIMDKGSPVRGIITNSGNANACTGKQGEADAGAMAEALASLAGAGAEEIFVCSTGVIGVPLPMDKVLAGISSTFPLLGDSYEHGNGAAEAIMTTDTFKKTAGVEVEIGGRMVTFGGMAKGSGMIHPNMATLLCFVTTDGDITPELLRKAVRESADTTFNMISVDGDTSTNDTLLVLANGMAGNPRITEENEDYNKFVEALHYINRKLAIDIARDGEGATKLLEVQVKGGASLEDARTIARSVTGSSLFKAALFGADANWGRALCAMGYSGGKFDPDQTSIYFRDGEGASLQVMDWGKPIIFDEDAAKAILSQKEIYVDIRLHQGEFEATAWGCDLTYDYVKINGDYRS